MIALAPWTDQNIPDCLRRFPITVLHPASITPEPTDPDEKPKPEDRKQKQRKRKKKSGSPDFNMRAEAYKVFGVDLHRSLD